MTASESLLPIDMGLTIEEVLVGLHALGYRGVDAYSHGAEHAGVPNWLVAAVDLGRIEQPQGEGDTPTAAYRACLDAAQALEARALHPSNRLASETW